MRRLSVVVAGCGTAGLAAALLLARSGHAVTLVERFDAPKPVGSGLMLQPTGLAVLGALGLGDEARLRGARVDRLHGRDALSGRVVLDVRYAALRREPRSFGIGIHRAALFSVLFEAVRGAGIAVETGRTVAGSEAASDGGRRLVYADGTRSARFDLVVDGLGTTTTLARPTGRTLPYGALWASLDWPEGAGLDPATLEQRYRGAGIMVGILPIGRVATGAAPQAAFFWSLRLDAFAGWRAAGLEVWKARVGALWPTTEPLLAQIRDAEQLTLARYAHRTLARPAQAGLVHIGDSWHSTSPQLGQGANMALLDAWALDRALGGPGDLADALARAVASRRRHVHVYQAMSRMFTPVYQSDSVLLPWLRDRVAGPLSRVPPLPRLLAATVAGLVGRPLAALGFED